MSPLLRRCDRPRPKRNRVRVHCRPGCVCLSPVLHTLPERLRAPAARQPLATVTQSAVMPHCSPIARRDEFGSRLGRHDRDTPVVATTRQDTRGGFHRNVSLCHTSNAGQAASASHSPLPLRIEPATGDARSTCSSSRPPSRRPCSSPAAQRLNRGSAPRLVARLQVRSGGLAFERRAVRRPRRAGRLAPAIAPGHAERVYALGVERTFRSALLRGHDD